MYSGRVRHMSEGVQGFAQAALAGGVPCLLASKWNIPLEESIILMTRAYTFMAENKVRDSQGGGGRQVAKAFIGGAVAHLETGALPDGPRGAAGRCDVSLDGRGHEIQA